jgi:ribosomal protein S18 acetylase RimI-like enzyme
MESLNIKILKATSNPEEVREVQNVIYRTWLATYPNKKLGITKKDINDRFKSKLTEEALIKKTKNISNYQTGKIVLVAKDRNKVIGICSITKYPEFNQLEAIYILPKYQNRGIGNSFWEKAQKYINLNKNTIVHVATYNEQAKKFYRSLGFKDIRKQWKNKKFAMKSGAIIPETEMILKGKGKG